MLAGYFTSEDKNNSNKWGAHCVFARAQSFSRSTNNERWRTGVLLRFAGKCEKAGKSSGTFRGTAVLGHAGALAETATGVLSSLAFGQG